MPKRTQHRSRQRHAAGSNIAKPPSLLLTSPAVGTVATSSESLIQGLPKTPQIQGDKGTCGKLPPNGEIYFPKDTSKGTEIDGDAEISQSHSASSDTTSSRCGPDAAATLIVLANSAVSSTQSGSARCANKADRPSSSFSPTSHREPVERHNLSLHQPSHSHLQPTLSTINSAPPIRDLAREELLLHAQCTPQHLGDADDSPSISSESKNVESEREWPMTSGMISNETGKRDICDQREKYEEQSTLKLVFHDNSNSTGIILDHDIIEPGKSFSTVTESQPLEIRGGTRPPPTEPQETRVDRTPPRPPALVKFKGSNNTDTVGRSPSVCQTLHPIGGRTEPVDVGTLSHSMDHGKPRRRVSFDASSPTNKPHSVGNPGDDTILNEGCCGDTPFDSIRFSPLPLSYDSSSRTSTRAMELPESSVEILSLNNDTYVPPYRTRYMNTSTSTSTACFSSTDSEEFAMSIIATITTPLTASLGPFIPGRRIEINLSWRDSKPRIVKYIPHWKIRFVRGRTQIENLGVMRRTVKGIIEYLPIVWRFAEWV